MLLLRVVVHIRRLADRSSSVLAAQRSVHCILHAQGIIWPGNGNMGPRIGLAKAFDW